MIGPGTGFGVMHRIAAPMIGGMVTAPLLSMLIIRRVSDVALAFFAASLDALGSADPT